MAAAALGSHEAIVSCVRTSGYTFFQVDKVMMKDLLFFLRYCTGTKCLFFYKEWGSAKNRKTWKDVVDGLCHTRWRKLNKTGYTVVITTTPILFAGECLTSLVN